jgi:uncharacterized protein with NRDE domain
MWRHLAWYQPVRQDRTPVSPQRQKKRPKQSDDARALAKKKRTNISETRPTEMASSRGHIVSSFLRSDSPHPLNDDQIGKIIPKDAKYAGFNLLLLAPTVSTTTNEATSSSSNSTLSFDGSIVSNGGANGTITSRTLTPDERHCGGISNGAVLQGGDDWPKVTHGVQSLNQCLKSITPEVPEMEVVNRLFELLT